jgi:hypothetical protein
MELQFFLHLVLMPQRSKALKAGYKDSVLHSAISAGCDRRLLGHKFVITGFID